MKMLMKTIFVFALILIVWACSPRNRDVSAFTTIIYPAKTILTVSKGQAEAVAVQDGMIVGVGGVAEMQTQFPKAQIDNSFTDQVLVPGLIDPHIHMILGAMMYARPFAPPWDVQTPNGIVKGLADRQAFLKGVAKIESEHKGKKPLVVYGYHNLVHGALDKHDLDAITTERPLIIWHYSGHDFYLNTKALAHLKVDASWAETYIGVPLGEDGLPTGRVYEDALERFFPVIGKLLLGPSDIKKGFNGFEDMLTRSGVTSVAELGYGLFGLKLENTYYKLFYGKDFNTRLYLVPEHRAFARKYQGSQIEEINKLVAKTSDKWPRVLPQIKLFTDAAFYSQTMRLQEPGYIAGQSAGHAGVWVTGPDILADTMRPYWQAGFDIRIHSNGDAAQTATLDALAQVRAEFPQNKQRLVIEHAGLVRPEHIEQAKTMNVGISAASHYVYYMGESYVEAIGERVKYMTPLASSMRAGLPTTVHSDAPLAPPSPLTAASVHMLRSTRQGGVLTPSERLSPEQALRAITLDAAWAMGLENEIGSIEVGKRADFTVLAQNPLTTKAEEWPEIKIWGVVLDGVKKPITTTHPK